MTAAEIVAWSDDQDAMGQHDAMGGRWSDWLLAVRKPDGACVRDQQGHQIFETQAAFKERQACPLAAPALLVGETMELFA
jgi:hypothetical protein